MRDYFVEPNTSTLHQMGCPHYRGTGAFWSHLGKFAVPIQAINAAKTMGYPQLRICPKCARE